MLLQRQIATTAQGRMAQRLITRQFAYLVSSTSRVSETTGSKLYPPFVCPTFTNSPPGCRQLNRKVLKTSGTLGIMAWFISSNSTPRQTSPTHPTCLVARVPRTLVLLPQTAPNSLGSKTISRMLTAKRHHGSSLVVTVLVRHASKFAGKCKV